MAVVKATESFTYDVSGRPVFVKKDQLWDSDDRVVKEYPGRFAEPEVNRSPEPRRVTRRAGAVETGTAAPGEQRTLSAAPSAVPPVVPSPPPAAQGKTPPARGARKPPADPPSEV